MTVVREVPLYRQVARRIAAGLGTDPHPGQRLPSERRLCADLGVSRVTLRSALAVLAEDGVLAPSPARGWFVADAPLAAADLLPVSGHVTGFSDSAAAHGQTTSATVLSAATRGCTLDEAEAFAVVAGSPVFELRRLRRIEDLVIAIDHSRVPLAICPDIADHDFTHTSLYAVLRSAEEAVEPALADYAVEAVQASAQEAQLLELPPGLPLLVARQRTRDQRGRVFELGETRYRGDRYRFRATLGSQR